MAVSDPRYLLLLVLVALVLPAIPRGISRLLAIALVSLGFYAGLNPAFWYVLVAVSATTYAGGLLLSHVPDGRLRSAIFISVVVAALLPLLTFKYVFWLAGIASPAFGHSEDGPGLARFVLPVGLSFYTFLGVGYLVDVFVGSVPAERNAIRFAAFMTFFPQLTAGPIERARHLLPQLDMIGEFDYARAVAGLRALLCGFFMKIVIADTLGPYVDSVYGAPHRYGAFDLALATVYFSFQVYADFAGYSLIAIGSARLLGIELLPNFVQPYLSQNLPEYWRRWHITLSSWFRDYVFIPLQFQIRRWGVLGLAGALIFTFILVGLWHGAGTKYALFGLIHGILVAFSTLTFARRDRFWRALGVPSGALALGRAVATFLVVSLTFVLFRAASLHDALWIYGMILEGPYAARTLPLILPALLISTLVVGDLMVASGRDLAHLPAPMRWPAYYSAFACIVVATVVHMLGASPHVEQFIYYKF